MAKQTARIDNWWVMGSCLCGNVTEHSRQKDFSPNCQQITSQLVRINECDRVAETANTHYKLGKKRVVL